MKVLIVGDAGSIFIKQYIEYVLLDNPDNKIVLLKEYDGISSNYYDFYKKNNVELEPLWNKYNRFINKIPIIRSRVGVKLWCVYIRKKYTQFDLIHIHGLNYSRGNVGKELKKYTKKLAISVWGDEIFRASQKKLKDYRKYYCDADCITISTKEMLNKFQKVYGDEFSDRIHMNKFAIGLFDIIDKVKCQYTRKENCIFFGIKDCNKFNVFVGFNGREAQRHFEIIKSLHNLPQECLKSINLVFTMTYGVKDEQYLTALEAAAKELGCDYVILRDFMNEETSARLRCICDVLLHAQITDAFSASIQESLYCGSIVVTGDWLSYTELPDWKSFFVTYSNFNEMAYKLEYILQNIDDLRARYSNNNKILYQISSRQTTTEMWKKSLKL